MLVECMDCRVDIVAAAEPALAALTSAVPPYDVVLLDIVLPIGATDTPLMSPDTAPDVAGYEALRVIRQDLRMDVPVIVVSALGLALAAAVDDLGATAVLWKPLRFEVLRDAIDSAVAGRH